MDKRKIYLIDNQVTQFKDICNKLKENGFEVVPSEDDFQKVLDYARIYLNKRYDPERRGRCINMLLDHIKANRPDLFIIDYKLTGCHDGRTGIHLALQLTGDDPELAKIPVLFLSRTLYNEEDVRTELEDKKFNHGWVNKGYAGMWMTHGAFFEKEVIPEIDNLLTKPEKDVYKEKVRFLKSTQRFSSYYDQLVMIEKIIDSPGEIDPLLKSYIDQCHSLKLDKNQMATIFSEIKKMLNK